MARRKTLTSAERRKARRAGYQIHGATCPCCGSEEIEFFDHDGAPPEQSEEELEDAFWQSAAGQSGDPNFRERFPEVSERNQRALRLAAEELGLEAFEDRDRVYVKRGPVPNAIAYHAAAHVFPEGWEMIVDPYPHDADVDYGYSYKDVTPEEEQAADEEIERRAREVWATIEPRL